MILQIHDLICHTIFNMQQKDNYSETILSEVDTDCTAFRRRRNMTPFPHKLVLCEHHFHCATQHAHQDLFFGFHPYPRVAVEKSENLDPAKVKEPADAGLIHIWLSLS